MDTNSTRVSGSSSSNVNQLHAIRTAVVDILKELTMDDVRGGNLSEKAAGINLLQK
ncbi:MAG: hypothetical protein LBF34_05150 [Puniceicoccales bacterium]|jgi:hypothetical protein|nr:hypothetical protein [Puniceicoccales bacterium]